MLAASAGLSSFATAQPDCATVPPGPARTDCYIGLSRINRQKSEISTSVAERQTDNAIFRKVTGKYPKKKLRRPMSAW
jgi:hypothetical protein